MASTGKKLTALVWKCLVLRFRNYLLTLLDLAAPLFLFYYLQVLLKDLMNNEPRLESKLQINILDIVSDGRIAYCPSNNQTLTIMNRIRSHGGFRIDLEEKKNEKELEIWLDNKTEKYFAETSNILSLDLVSYGVVFLELNESTSNAKYKLRPCDGHIKTVNKGDGRYDREYSPYGPPGGMLGTQVRLNLEYLYMTGLSLWNGKMTISPIEDSAIIGNVEFEIMYIFFIVAYIFFVISIIRDIIQEKSSGIKEYMRIVGLPSWMIWTHWLIYTLLVHLPVTIGTTIIFTMLSTPLFAGNFFIIWLLIFMFTITCTFILFILSCFFNGPTLGTTISVFLWVFGHVAALYYLFNPSDFGTILQVCICFLPLHNLIWGLETIQSFHKSGTMWKISHFFVIGESGSNVSIGSSLIISIIEIFFLILLLVYVDGVMPGKYGVAKPFTFICHVFYGTNKDSENIPSLQIPLPRWYETPPTNVKVGIGIRGLKKVFGHTKKITAVDCVNLDIYEGEIMALLGHNGAGKTTTMSMITGMFSPTNGVILFGGKDINKDASYRDSLGLCTQHDMYFPKLTVIEHLIFFGMLRGMSFTEAKHSGSDLLALLNIKEKSRVKANYLSGGMKRRLCLAISLVGGPKVLILDEPTSGLDPENRRKIWDIILGMRGERTILITTHFMEEADVLGDRIAIMDHGNVVCCGTTMFVKRLYGTGYQLHLLKESNTSPADIYNLIQLHVPSFQVVSVLPTQINLNLKESDVKYFPILFEALEIKKTALGIKGISITCTSMEDVFLNVANKSTIEEAGSKPIIKVNDKQTTNRAIIQDSDCLDLFCYRWKVLFIKLILYRINKITNVMFIVLLTCLAVWCLMLNSTVNKITLERQPPLAMSLAVYPKSYNLLVNDDKNKKLAAAVEDLIKGNKGEVDNLPVHTNIEKFLKKLSDSDYPKFSRFLLYIRIKNDTMAVQYRQRYHIPPIIINLITNAVLRHASPNSNGTIETIIHPYVPKGPRCDGYSIFISYIWAVSMTFIFSWILATFTVLVTEERVNGFKQQQYLTGVSPFLYWISNFSFDFILYLLIIILYLMVIVITGGQIVLVSEWFYVLALVFIFLGISGIFFVYVYSYLIDSPNVSYNTFILCGMMLTFVPLYWLADVKSFTLHTFIICILCLNPLFPFMKCVFFLSNIMYASFLCKSCNFMCEEASKPIFTIISEDDSNKMLPYVVFLALNWIVYLCIIMLIDHQLHWKILLFLFHEKFNPNEAKDTDVLGEIQQVKQQRDTDDFTIPLRAQWLGKTYLFGPKAVKNVSFALLPGECFGLLGVNGAGKTTTFKMLIGEIYPNYGDAVIHGISVIDSSLEYKSKIGYCPQYDTFPQYLTGEQVLMLIALLRGIKKRSAKKEVLRWFKLMGITEHAKKKGGTYSGGTKRKLSTAMAFIGKPVVVFLDEPTTGVDPEARRKLWTVMQERQKEGQAIVLTSHSMEECEALCTRLTIMREGEMMCLGTPEYLKNRFSLGYTVLVKLNDPTHDKLIRLKADFQKYIPDSVVKDEHHSLINYQVTDPRHPLSRLFTILLQLKEAHKVVEDFSISNTTLEQLFLSFASR